LVETPPKRLEKRNPDEPQTDNRLDARENCAAVEILDNPRGGAGRVHRGCGALKAAGP
jgi:hypothetical protein